MNSEERFKKSLEELLASKDFTFDETNWDKARQMIDASKKPRRMAPFIVAGSVLLVSLLTSIYFLSESPLAPVEKLTATSTIQTESPSSAAKVNLPEKTIPATRANFKAASAKMQVPLANTAKSSEPVTKKTPAFNTVQSKTMKTAALHAGLVPSNDLPGKENLSQNAALASVAPQRDPVTAIPVNNSPQKNTDVKATDAKSQGTQNEAEAAKSNDHGTPGDQAIAGNQSVPEKIKESPEQFASDVTPPVNSSVQSSVNEPSSAATNNSSESNENVLVSSPAIKDSLVNNSIATLDVPSDNDRGEVGKPKDYPVLFSVEAGTNYMYGWQNPKTRDASGFNPVIGINYFNNFKPKMSLSIGLQYSSVSNLSYSNYTTKVTRLSLGEESKVTVFTPVKVHYLIVPLRFNYSINAMNIFGVGCNIAYLLNVESDVETYTEKLNTKYDQTLTKTTGYTEGFNVYDTQLSLFYKRRLYPNLALNLEMFYGLTDVKNNKFFNSNVFERNTGLKLTLVYNFLKK